MTLLELLILLRKNLVFTLAVPLACAAVVGLYSFIIMPDTYGSEVSVYALVDGSVDAATGGGVVSDTSDYTTFQFSQNLVKDITTLATSKIVLDQVAEELKLDNLGQFDISVTNELNSRLIVISVEGSDSVAVPLVANKLAEVLEEQAKRVMNIQAANIVSSAESPAPVVGPPRLLYVAVAAFAGLFIAIALLVLRDMVDTAVRSEDELTEITGLPIIGRLPSV